MNRDLLSQGCRLRRTKHLPVASWPCSDRRFGDQGSIVLFDPLPPGWVVEQNVMDPMWEPLGFNGVNYYAYGGPATGNDFSARSDNEYVSGVRD